MDPFLDFDDTTIQEHNHQPVNLIDYLTASASDPHSATEDGSHWTQQDQQMGYYPNTATPSQAPLIKSSTAATTTSGMVSYTSPSNTSDALAASLGFHLGDASFDPTNDDGETEQGLSDDTLARLLFAPSSADSFMTSTFEPLVQASERQGGSIAEQELAAAYAAFAQQQQQQQGEQGWFTQQRQQMVPPPGQYGESVGGYGYNNEMTTSPQYQAYHHQQQQGAGYPPLPPTTSTTNDLYSLSSLGNNPCLQTGMETTLIGSVFPNTSTMHDPRLYSHPSKPSDEYMYEQLQLAAESGHHAENQHHGHAHSPASTSSTVGGGRGGGGGRAAHSSSPTASHGAVSVSLHPFSNHPSSSSSASSSSASSVGLSPGNTSGTSGSPVHVHATPSGSTGSGSGSGAGRQVGGAALKPFVVGEGMTLAPQLLNVHHHRQQQLLNASLVEGGLNPGKLSGK